MELGLFVIRAVVGLLFVGHGAQKLFGSFGGYGVSGTGGYFESIGLRPGRQMAIAAGLAELLGGALLALGLMTPLAALLIISTMVTAIVTVHLGKGVWNESGGYELNLTYVAAVFALAAIGPGAWSLDAVLGVDAAGAGWALAVLAVGLVGGLGAVLAGRRGRSGRTSGQPSATTA